MLHTYRGTGGGGEIGGDCGGPGALLEAREISSDPPEIWWKCGRRKVNRILSGGMVLMTKSGRVQSWRAFETAPCIRLRDRSPTGAPTKCSPRLRGRSPTGVPAMCSPRRWTYSVFSSDMRLTCHRLPPPGAILRCHSSLGFFF